MLRSSKPLSVIQSVCIALLIFTLSVAAPILLRPFYYAHIGPLDLEGYTGLSRGEIVTAYNEMMDYCLGLRGEFSVGVLPWSASGRDHFADVRTLFLLDLAAAALSALGLGATILVARRRWIIPHRLRGHGPGFWAAAGLAAVVTVVGVLAALDFQRAFTVFHTLFFPGKTNWIFDWQTDPIILLLPEVFFRNCAIAIGALMVLACGVLVVLDLRLVRRHKNKKSG